MIGEHPYQCTSDDVIYTVWVDRKGLPKEDRPAVSEEFYSTGTACLRASDLGKKYGWGIHHDADRRVALFGMETAEYGRFASGQALAGSGELVSVKKALRSSRG